MNEHEHGGMAPCGDCGDTAIPCACDKPIETIAQLQRSMEAAGASGMTLTKFGSLWSVVAPSAFGAVSAGGDTLSEAIDRALDALWELR